MTYRAPSNPHPPSQTCRRCRLAAVVLLAALAIVPSSLAAPHIKGIKLAVENPTARDWPAADIVIRVADLRKVAADFRPGSFIVTATDAATVDQDAAVLRSVELPAQADDLDGDNKADEIAFQIDLQPHQTRIVTISYGDADRIWRLRSDYPHRTGALFATKIEGLGWESERNAWRIYFDPRNAIDLYGKRRLSLQLPMFAAPDYDYHAESPEGRDIYKVGDAIGIGAVAALVDGKVVKVADVAGRNWRILATGPVRSIVELSYDGWNVGGQRVQLRSRITQWAGERGFVHAITATPSYPATYVTGLPRKRGLDPLTSAGDAPVAWLATWGEQAVAPGATATEAVPGQNLGLAVLTAAPGVAFSGDADNHFVQLKLERGAAEWYCLAAWDQEGTNRIAGPGNQPEKREGAAYAFPPDGITSRAGFVAAVEAQAARLREPVRVTMVSAAAAPQAAPPDTLAPARPKTFGEAVDLLRQEVDRTAARFTPLLLSSPSTTYGKGPGFFVEGNNASGEWKPREGFWWTGSFWVGELWRFYERTRDNKYRRWAEAWGSRLLGQEQTLNHDAGFVYFYSSALGYDLTHDAALQQSALRAAERLQKLYNPKTQMIAAWSENGDDSIVDTMMNLQLLWWASRQTGDPQWRALGLRHALRSAQWLVRPNGSVIQSVHYNPGDNRQTFLLHGGSARDPEVQVANRAAPGEWVFHHTHQGWSAETAWARGTGWALYGFAVAWQETREPRLRETAERVADFALDNLPDDAVPWYDLYDEGVRYRNRDTSAAAILAGGLLRLSAAASDAARAQRYRAAAERILQSLVDRYLAPVAAGDPTPPGILRHGSSTRPGDVALIYGQYYLLDALLWLEQHPAAR